MSSQPMPGLPESGAFFANCAFVSVDFQESHGKHYATSIPKLWEEMGYTVEDVNAATDFGHDVALPNALKVAEACRDLGLPMIFIHWQTLFEDGMDLEPAVRRSLVKEQGEGNVRGTSSRPNPDFNIQPGDYIVPKAGQDAFQSSNIDFLLTNLGVRNIVFVGGHTNKGGCLHRTAKSARERGYTILCVEDATYDAGESTRVPGIMAAGFDHVVTTANFLKMAAPAAKGD